MHGARQRICPECDTPSEVRFCPRCGTRTLVLRSEQSDAMLGRILAGRYRLDAVIGRGGMGIVYRATQVAMGKTVAVKMIKADFAGKLEAVKRFHREAQAASLLSHPHTVKVFDFGQTDAGELFLVMEHLTGRPLSALIADAAPLAPGRAAKLGLEVAQALGEAHAAGLAHRDLKPDNVMLVEVVGDPEFVKVLDFGIAKLLTGDSADSGTTATGALMGTPYYMSPEQAQGLRAITPATDIYSLGVVLYEMLCGAKPFDGPSALQIVLAHANQAIAAELPDDPPVPPRLRELVHRMLAKDPAARPGAGEVIETCAGLAASPGDTPPPRRRRDTLPGIRPQPAPSEPTPLTVADRPRPESSDPLPAPPSRRAFVAAGATLLGLGGAAVGYLALRRTGGSGGEPAPVAVAPAPADAGAPASAPTDAAVDACPRKTGMKMMAPMYRARSVDAAEDDCPKPSHHRDRRHGVIECHYGTVFFLRTERGHRTCIERAEAVAERLNASTRAMSHSGGYFSLASDGRHPAIRAQFGDDRAPVRIVTVTRSDLAAYRTRSRAAGCERPPDERLLARWWMALLTDHYRVMTLGVEPVATGGTAAGAALEAMYRDAREVCPGDGPIPMSVFADGVGKLSRRQRDDLLLASYMVPCGWRPDTLSLPR